jgi:hypothetical protein
VAQSQDSLGVSIFTDVYLSWFPHSSKVSRLPYIVNYTGTNRTNINFAAASLHYQRNHFRTNLGLMTGNYAKTNLSSEDKWARNIYEANIGYRFTSDKEVWLDVGVLPSHIGFESVPSKNNWAATRSLVADLSPYYETGMRLSYRPNKQWYFSIMALNGWQRITAPLADFGKSWGMQISYEPLSGLLINSSSFIGKVTTEKKDITTRIYSNLFATYKISPRLSVMGGWDWGIQENRTKQWNTLLLNSRYALFKNLFTNLRYEYVSDPRSIFRPDLTNNVGNKVNMTSFNIDFIPVKVAMLRVEVNYAFSPSSIFPSADFNNKNQLSFYLIASINMDYSK